MDDNELPPYSLVRTHCANGRCQGGCVMWCGPWRERKRARKQPVSAMQAGDEKTRGARVPYLCFKRRRYAVRTLVAIEHKLPAASPSAQFSTSCGNYWCVAPEHICLWQMGRPFQKRPVRALTRPLPHDEDSYTQVHSTRTEETDEEDSRYAALSSYASYDGEDDDEESLASIQSDCSYAKLCPPPPLPTNAGSVPNFAPMVSD